MIANSVYSAKYCSMTLDILILIIMITLEMDAVIIPILQMRKLSHRSKLTKIAQLINSGARISDLVF